MSAGSFRTQEDLQRAVRALATEFNTNKVYIIGSQAILLAWPEAPVDMMMTPEIDAFPANAKAWELEETKRNPSIPAEASEHIHGLFGEGSDFHTAHGFYIDGVDEHTAKLPKDWEKRAVVRFLDVRGRTITVIAPEPEDIIVSKLARLDPKDKRFIETYHAVRPLNPALIEERISLSDFDPAVATRALNYIRSLP